MTNSTEIVEQMLIDAYNRGWIDARDAMADSFEALAEQDTDAKELFLGIADTIRTAELVDTSEL